MKKLTITIPDDKFDLTIKYLRKLAFAKITGDGEIILDKKEKGMLSLMLKGFSVKEIAHKLHINYVTAQHNKSKIIDKVDPKHPDNLTRYIIQYHLLGVKMKNDTKSKYIKLYKKQKEILLYMLKGAGGKEIAHKFHIDLKAALEHKNRILAKIYSGNPTGIIRYIIKQNLLKKTLSQKRDVNNKAGLTEREKEILPLVLKGNSSGDIAGTLKLSKRTVETHRSSILRKTKAKNSVDLMSYAVKNKLIRL